jgi:hypothetical protein
MQFSSLDSYLQSLKRNPSLSLLPMQVVADHRGVTRAAVDSMLRAGKLTEIKINKVRYVQAASVIALDDAVEEQIRIVRSFIEEKAIAGQTVTYEPVMATIGLSTRVPADRKRIGMLLGKISGRSYDEHQILLTAIVIRSTGKPGPGFESLVDSIGIDYEDIDELVEAEAKKVFKHYKKMPKAR